MQALWGEPTSDFTRMRRNRMHVCCGLVAEWLSLASLLCSESMLRRCAKSTFETFELQRPMYVRCKPHVPLLNLNRTHAPSEGDGRTIHDNIYKYTDSAGVDRTRVLFYGSALLLFSARSPCCDAAPSRPLRPLNFNVRCTLDVNPTCRF